MLKRAPLVLAALSVSAAIAAIAACSSNPSPSASSGTSGTTSGTGTGSTGSTASTGATGSSAPTDAGSDAGSNGLLVDNMTMAPPSITLELTVPAGETPGSYYTYEDNKSDDMGTMTLVESTGQLKDVPVSPAIANADGTTIQGELCVSGRVTEYGGLGLSLAYGHGPDASPDSGLSSAVPFDASQYSGASFYIMTVGDDAGAPPTVHFSIPDTQTADPAAWPAAACDFDGGICDDDFGKDATPPANNVWTKVTASFSALSQQNFGTQFPNGILSNQLIGMKWQVNGDGSDASIVPFQFCISDIYFTP
ncbi:MAG TPA: hypothetical protein VK841_18585 [Polyangiaceae bacterium]|nr:hypothetical protein [Polyangiaceae bacterium]